ncbi:hypothetical protein [Desulfocurvibacter africanus]|nr:hypothetical protein [Desulfocurvibacter africanus]
MRQAIDLAMADRFLNVSMGWDEQDEEERPGGGIGLNSLGMNMLATLGKLQAYQNSDAEQGRLTQARSSAKASSGSSDAEVASESAHAAGRPNGEASMETDSEQAEVSMEEIMGVLSRAFESGGEGSQAIGWDKVGGTSYGMFQLSSRQGSMDNFLAFLDGEAPEWSARLRKAGPSNTGGRDGAMPREWRAIAAENPELFEALQQRFINDTHYQPALQAIQERTGLNIASFPKALQEVLFSTAVQHGPAGAANIFAQAAGGLDGIIGQAEFSGEAIAENLIREIYTLRSTRFGSSTEQVQAAVRNRLKSEHKLAMNLLGGMNGSELA